MNEWMSDWMNEGRNERMNERTNEQMNECKRCSPFLLNGIIYIFVYACCSTHDIV